MEALAGSSGWAGAGLLGLVLAWLLLKHLPAKDAQIERVLQAHAAQIERLTTSHAAEIDRARKDYAENLQRVLDYSQREIASLATVLNRDLSALTQAVTALHSVIVSLSGKAG